MLTVSAVDRGERVTVPYRRRRVLGNGGGNATMCVSAVPPVSRPCCLTTNTRGISTCPTCLGAGGWHQLIPSVDFPLPQFCILYLSVY